jgi:hypothetical protein
MSDVDGKAENICSQRVFRILTRFGHPGATILLRKPVMYADQVFPGKAFL